jgi:hypothetical protein
LEIVSGHDDFLLSLFVLAAADVEPVDGHDDVAGLKAEGFAQGLKINLKTKK